MSKIRETYGIHGKSQCDRVHVSEFEENWILRRCLERARNMPLIGVELLVIRCWSDRRKHVISFLAQDSMSLRNGKTGFSASRNPSEQVFTYEHNK